MTHTFPKAFQKFDRTDSGPTPMPLDVVSGTVPDDLTGAVYIVGPVGGATTFSVDTPFLNGDGTIYQLTLGKKPSLRWALAKPPCYWAEKVAKKEHPHQRFRDWGITRLSDDFTLGGRNLLNTALQVVRFEGDTSDRLLVTYESGRPFEVDPVSLEVITPIGAAPQWRATLLGGSPFEVVSTTSHPAFDRDKNAKGEAGPGTLFMVNFVRDSKLYLELMKRAFSKPPQGDGDALREWVNSVLPRSSDTRALWQELLALPGALERLWARLKRLGENLATETNAQLLWWDGRSKPSQVEIVDDQGKPLAILQSAHQVAVTEHWVVLVDAAFKFELDLVLPAIGFDLPTIRLFFRERLSRMQPQEVAFHLIPRAKLVDGATVTAISGKLPCACVHYYVDYDDAGGSKIALHAIDNAAMDTSEFLESSDFAKFPAPGETRLPEHVLGMMPSGLDVDRITRFDIDVDVNARKATPHEKSSAADEKTMWTVALATSPTLATAAAPTPLEHLYFYTHGLVPEAIANLTWGHYADKEGEYALRRIVPLPALEDHIRDGGVPAHLCRYDAKTSKIADSYAVPEGWFALSPQFVPVAGKNAPFGYLVCTAFGPDLGDKEIWVLDAAKLAAGPICKLRAPEGKRLPWGYTLHTTFIQDPKPRPAGGYRVGVAEDMVSVLPGHEDLLAYVAEKAYRP